MFEPGVDMLGREKPCFDEGTLVEFDLSSTDQKFFGRGRIRGLCSQHVVDMWIVEIEGSINFYPWSCIVVPHTLLKRIVE